jgi:hypothetical protein
MGLWKVNNGGVERASPTNDGGSRPALGERKGAEMSDDGHIFYIEHDRKYGGFDFGVRATIGDLSFDEMNAFRAMLIVAIGTAEDMWRREVERRNPAQQAEPRP